MSNADKRLRRAPVVRIYEVRDSLTILASKGGAAKGQAHELRGPSAALARVVIAHCQAPRTRAQILAHVAEQTGAPLDVAATAVVDELLALLEASEVLIPAPDSRARPRPPSKPRARLVLALCGAVAAALAPALVALLQSRGFELRVIATPSALRFVHAEVLEALVHQRVRASLWPEGEGPPVPHINLGEWADVVLVWPATATTLARLGAGDHSTLVSALALSTPAPVVVVPSMNTRMFTAPAVQRNLDQLITDGVHVVHPGSGVELADTPEGRVAALGSAPPHAVVADVLELIVRRTQRPGPPRDAADWDRLFRTRRERELDWHRDELDEDLQALLTREAGPGKQLLDLGTGLGVGAEAAAALGYRVVATDLSAVALERARERVDPELGARIIWVRDDITDTRLQARFDLILDRGCLHLLEPAGARAYADAVARLCAPGGRLVLKLHASSEGSERGTTPYDSPALERLLGPRFVLEAATPSSIPGPRASPAATCFVLRRARAAGRS